MVKLLFMHRIQGSLNPRIQGSLDPRIQESLGQRIKGSLSRRIQGSLNPKYDGKKPCFFDFSEFKKQNWDLIKVDTQYGRGIHSLLGRFQQQMSKSLQRTLA